MVILRKDHFPYELNSVSRLYDMCPEENREDVTECTHKYMQWEYIKHLLIKLINQMREIRGGGQDDDDKLEVDETDKMDVVYECFCKEREKLQVEKRIINIGDPKWHALDKLLFKTNSCLWEVKEK